MRKLALIGLLLLFSFAASRAQEKTQPQRILCILVEFEDCTFTLEEPAAYFTALLSEEGFSLEGGKGSVKDYYRDNSLGKYVPEFGALGPISLPGRMAEYGRNRYEAGYRVGDAAPEMLLPDALAALELAGEDIQELVDAWDAFYLIFAGYDEAEGGPADALWSQYGWSEVVVGQEEEEEPARLLYACSAELSGSSGARPSGIGIVCHEMGHLLGLPDFYDTDGPLNGIAATPVMYSLMAVGGQNLSGHQPPYLSALERLLLGWTEEIPMLPDGKVSLGPVQEEGAALRSLTDQEGEYFIYEYRSGKGWDEGLAEGLLVYHTDQSEPQRWNLWQEDNRLNAFASHPLCYIIRSANPGQSLQVDASLSGGHFVFPGLAKRRCFESLDWAGNSTGLQLTDIGIEEGLCHFRVLHATSPQLNGVVHDAAGKPLFGAVVTVSGIEDYVLSDKDGFFAMDLPDELDTREFTLTATMAGYRSSSVRLVLEEGERMACAALVLQQEEAGDERLLRKFDDGAQFGYFPAAAVGAVRFSPIQLAPYAGLRITEIGLYPWLDPSFDGELFIAVQIDGNEVLMRAIPHPVRVPYFLQTVDVSDIPLVIPEGRELSLVMGSDKPGKGFYLGTVYPAEKGSSYYKGAGEDSWKPLYVDVAGFYMDVALQARVQEQTAAPDLGALGYTCIADPQSGVYTAGTRFLLKLSGYEADTATASWTFNGTPAEGESVVLVQGKNVIEAKLQHAGEVEETLRLTIACE